MSAPRLLTATFLLTAGSLAFEVALSRMLSLVHYSGFVFALLAAALLGVGLGAALAALRPALRREERLGDWTVLAAGAALLLTVVINLAAAQGSQLLQLALVVPPFLFTGLALSSLFSLRPDLSHRLYWADLVGAGCGTLLALPLLAWLGGTSAALAGALLLAAAAVVFRPRWSVAPLVVAVAVLGNALGGWFEPDMARLPNPKPLTNELRSGAVTVASASSSFARSDLVRRPGTDAHYLYVDGAAGSLVPLADDTRLQNDIGYLPFRVLRPQSAFLLGLGGGLDASLARLAGTRRIVAAELNGRGLELVAGVNPDAYAGVEVHVDEGRSVLRHLQEEFDLIFLAHVITQSSDLRGFALSEASTYTIEAFADYLQHLRPGGVLAIKLYDELTLARAFFTAWQTLVARGADPGRHLFAALDPRASQPLPLLLVARDPLDQAAAVALARASEEMGFGLLYVPGLLVNPPLDRLVTGQADVQQLVSEARSGGTALKPATDAAPFFFQFEAGVPTVLRPVAWAGLALLVATLLLFAFRRRPTMWPAAPLTFAALGAGFIAVELSFIHRAQLFLGHPTLTLSLVLATLLIGGGFGSLVGERVRRPLLWGPLLTVALAVLWHAAWPALTGTLQGSSLTVRAVITSGSMLPVSLCLGFQLPAGLRLLGGRPQRVAAAWAVNGFYSVIGSVASIVLALSFGYQAVLGLGVGCYLLVLLTGAGAMPAARSSGALTGSSAGRWNTPSSRANSVTGRG